MWTYTNLVGVTFTRKLQREMIDFLTSGAGQTLASLDNRHQWNIVRRIIAGKEIRVFLQNTVTGEVYDEAIATKVT